MLRAKRDARPFSEETENPASSSASLTHHLCGPGGRVRIDDPGVGGLCSTLHRFVAISP